MRADVALFEDDETYFHWLSLHPDGYVLNLRRRGDPDYVVLHRATCPLIASRGRAAGAYTARGYRKAASTSLAALASVARCHGRADGSFSRRCRRCAPPASAGAE